MKRCVIISAYTYMQNRFKSLSNDEFSQVNNYEPLERGIDKLLEGKNMIFSPLGYIETNHDLSSLTTL